MERLELLLHPVRMRVVLALANRVLTTQQLADLLPDVPQTTLYRHINLLLEGDILRVVRESKVRGTLERELTLVEGTGRIDRATSAALPPGVHAQIFTTFIATLMAEFERAQAHPREGIPPAFYTQQRVYMTLDELQQVNQRLDNLLAHYKDPSRQTVEANVQSWLVTGIIMPEADLSQSETEKST